MDSQSIIDAINHNWVFATIVAALAIFGIIVARFEIICRTVESLFRIKEQIRESKMQELDSLKNMADNESLPEPLRHAAHEHWISRTFSSISGIKVSTGEIAQTLAAIHNRYPTDAKWKTLKRASPFITINNGIPTVTIRKRTRLFFWFGRIYAILVTLIALIILVFFGHYSEITWQIWTVVLILFVLAAFCGYIPTLACESAMKIRKVLESDKQSDIQRET